VSDSPAALNRRLSGLSDRVIDDGDRVGNALDQENRMFLEDLGRRLRDRRELRGLKQGDIANALGVSPQAVSKWERGENAPDISLLTPLAKLLGVTTDFLLGRHEGRADETDATVFVTSITGFTARSETLTPAEVAIWCNGFFHQITESVLERGGVPVKYIGDGMLAFFAGGDHRERAIAASIAARAVVTDPLVIGLVTGPVHLAAIGHASYARPDILGQTVNRAFRVLAAMGNSSRIAIVRSDSDAGSAFRFGAPVTLSLKGVTEPLQICEVVGSASACRV
jgi:class 3 adenylate cyclase